MIEPTEKLYDGYYLFIKMEAAVMTSLSHKFNQWDIYISMIQPTNCLKFRKISKPLNIANFSSRKNLPYENFSLK